MRAIQTIKKCYYELMLLLLIIPTVVKVKRITRNLYFILATFLTCFFSQQFSSFNDEKIKLTSITKSESQLVTIVMFKLMIKKKVN